MTGGSVGLQSSFGSCRATEYSAAVPSGFNSRTVDLCSRALSASHARDEVGQVPPPCRARSTRAAAALSSCREEPRQSRRPRGHLGQARTKRVDGRPAGRRTALVVERPCDGRSVVSGSRSSPAPFLPHDEPSGKRHAPIPLVGLAGIIRIGRGREEPRRRGRRHDLELDGVAAPPRSRPARLSSARCRAASTIAECFGRSMSAPGRRWWTWLRRICPWACGSLWAPHLMTRSGLRTVHFGSTRAATGWRETSGGARRFEVLVEHLSARSGRGCFELVLLVLHRHPGGT